MTTLRCALLLQCSVLLLVTQCATECAKSGRRHGLMVDPHPGFMV